jgi:hypothetical protein
MARGRPRKHRTKADAHTNLRRAQFSSQSVLAVALQPILLGGNGYYGWIQRLKYVYVQPPRSSDCRLLMVYKGVKIQPSLGAIFVSRNFMFWLVSQEPGDLWTNGGHKRIQRIK